MENRERYMCDIKLPCLSNNIIKKKLVERVKVGHGVTVIGRLYRETDTVLKKLLILIKY